jgi:hypothetical protein
MSLDALGKIFISHSSPDKAFVRRLAKRLEKAGYSVWLDEKELRVGDALSAEISAALKASPVVIVVVSSVSVKSKWLDYELSIATERMIKGECRVIPVVIGDVTPPAQVTGLLYADFRKGFALGVRAITSALEHEKRNRLAAAPIYVRVRDAVSHAFGGIGSVSVVGGYKGDDWDTVSVPVPSENDPDSTDVHYDWVSSYVKPPKPLTSAWLGEFHDFADKIEASLNLIVTDQPVAVEVIRPDPAVPQVSYMERFKGRSVTVFVEIGNLADDQWKVPLRLARDLLTGFAQKLSSPRT